MRITVLLSAARKTVLVAWELSRGMVVYAGLRFGWCRPTHPQWRRHWLGEVCQRLCRVVRLEAVVLGTVPTRGWIISNHLSYLDIMLLSALTPAVFVAKREVRRWPVFGWYAYQSGTIFVDRERRSDVVRSSDLIQAALADGAPVILFPEGTSSGGETVLPFRSSLFEAAASEGQTLTAAALAYGLDDGDPAEDVCYWKDMTLVPHVLKLMTRHRVRACVAFSPGPAGSGLDRKELCRRMHTEVLRLHALARTTVDDGNPRNSGAVEPGIQAV